MVVMEVTIIMMMKMLAVFLVIHGLISGAQASGSFSGFKPGLANPTWLAWWPGKLGESWLLNQLGVTHKGVYAAMGVIWLLAAVGFGVAAVVMWAQPERGAWAPYAGGAAVLSLIVLGIYLHPWYAGAVALNIALVAMAAFASQPR